MSDRFCKDLETALSSFSKQNIDMYYDDEDTEEEYEDDDVHHDVIDDRTDELACPFCFEDLDVLGLCCHIDSEHWMEVKHGICPVCVAKVGTKMVSHVITQHEKILKVLCIKRHRSSHSRSAISMLRKELQEKRVQCLKKSSTVDSSDVVADSMLLSFVHNNSKPSKKAESVQPSDKAESTRATSSTEASLSGKISDDNSLESVQPSQSTDSGEEKASKHEFVQGLLMSTMWDDVWPAWES